MRIYGKSTWQYAIKYGASTGGGSQKLFWNFVCAYRPFQGQESVKNDPIEYGFVQS